MAGVLYIRDPETGEFVPVPTLVGPPGPGVPAGGAAGQVLVKSGEADYETQWKNPYPVGAIYISADDTSPAALFGGEWTQIKGRFLIGTGTPELNYDGTSPGIYDIAAGSTGGNTTHAHAAGNLYAQVLFKSTGVVEAQFKRRDDYDTYKPDWVIKGTTTATYTAATENTNRATPVAGTSAASSSMPPYLAVYMWKRVS